MMAVSPVELAFLGVLCLIGVGMYGLLAMRNLIRIIIALQILVKGAVLALVVAGRVSGQTNLGQSLVATVIMADTVVAVIGLALAVQVKRRIGTLDVGALSRLRE
jgi:NADH-quinone oxidoreductase subunit K